MRRTRGSQRQAGRPAGKRHSVGTRMALTQCVWVCLRIGLWDSVHLSMRFGIKDTSVQIPTLPLSSCVSGKNELSHSGPQVLCLWNGIKSTHNKESSDGDYHANSCHVLQAHHLLGTSSSRNNPRRWVLFNYLFFYTPVTRHYIT